MDTTSQTLSRKQALIAGLMVFISLALFFLPPPFEISSPWLANLWDIGHLAIFFVITWQISPLILIRVSTTNIAMLSTAVATILLATAIEVAQSYLTREASVRDLLLSAIGMVFGLLTNKHYRTALYKHPLKITSLIAVCMVYSIMPFIELTVDKALSLHQHPAIISFATPLERLRLSGNTHITLANYPPEESEMSANITFSSEPYSTTHIERFNSNWEGYSNLHLDIYLTGEQPLRIQLSIEDSTHSKGPRSLNDRFTKLYTLHPGRNYLRILLKEVENAPLERQMSLTQIEKITLYTMNLKAERSIFLNTIQLFNIPQTTKQEPL